MTLRIVLSLLLLALLASCAARDQAAPADDEPCGIGTSPSGPNLPAAPALVESSVRAELPVCGIWIDASEAAADTRALTGEPPDVLVYAGEHSTCIDALAVVAARWPRRAVVRYAAEVWRASAAPP